MCWNFIARFADPQPSNPRMMNGYWVDVTDDYYIDLLSP